VVYLLNYHFLTEDRLAELMSDLFGLKLVPATIARMSAACAQGFRDFADAVRERVAQARVKHMDETGSDRRADARAAHFLDRAVDFLSDVPPLKHRSAC
jgi:Transposase IS66 family